MGSRINISEEEKMRITFRCMEEGSKYGLPKSRKENKGVKGEETNSLKRKKKRRK